MKPSNISEILLSARTKLQTNVESDPRGRIVIIIGESGSGKTFRIVRPNILGFHSLIVTDYYGELQKDTNKSLNETGCRVQKFAFNDRENSYHYNPFCFINTKKDVEELASGILDNLHILGVDETEDEKVRAAGQVFLCMMIAYTRECTAPEMQTFAKMFKTVRMVRLVSARISTIFRRRKTHGMRIRACLLNEISVRANQRINSGKYNRFSNVPKRKDCVIPSFCVL